MSGDVFFRILLGAGLLGLSGYALKKSEASPIRKNPAPELLSSDELLATLPSVVEFNKNPPKLLVEIDGDSTNQQLEEYCYGLSTLLFKNWLDLRKKSKVSLSARNEYINYVISNVLFPPDETTLQPYLKNITSQYFKPGSKFSVSGVEFKIDDTNIVKHHNSLKDIFFAVMCRFLDRQSFLSTIRNDTLLCLPFADTLMQHKDSVYSNLMLKTWEDASNIFFQERRKKIDYKKIKELIEEHGRKQKRLKNKRIADIETERKLKEQKDAYDKMLEEEEREDEDDEPLTTYSSRPHKKTHVTSTAKISEHDRFRHQRLMMALERPSHKK